MTPKEVLIAARKKIENPKNWTQYTEARNSRGVSCNPINEAAVCWCATGALRSVSPYSYHYPMEVLELSIDNMFVSWFNDTHTHAEVLAAFDRAIEVAP